MRVSSAPMNGTFEVNANVQKPMNELAKTPDPVDAVRLSVDSVTQSEHHIAYSLNIKTQKVETEIQDLAISFLG